MKAERFRQIHPDVFICDLFTRSECKFLLGRIAEQKVDREAPNSMNKYGKVLGGELKPLLARLTAMVGRVARKHYPEIARLKKHPYGFTIDYSVGGQKSLAAHFDSSDVTLNVCLGKKFEGGGLLFYGKNGKGATKFELEHAVGRAIIHRGKHIHRAKPITSGERQNLILWCSARKS